MKQLKECRVKSVQLEVRMGAARTDVIREAICLAVEEWVIVDVAFNNDEFTFDPARIVEVLTGKTT